MLEQLPVAGLIRGPDRVGEVLTKVRLVKRFREKKEVPIYMGGHGSGYSGTSKQCVEQCLTLTASWMLQNDYFDLAVHSKRYHHTIGWSNYFNEPSYTLTFDIERTSLIDMKLFLRDTRQLVYVIATPMRFGGLRWWFKCPVCFARCANLYLGRMSEKFGCRVCLDLTYRSCQRSHGNESLLVELAARMGITVSEVKQQIKETQKPHKRSWVRKRDRRRNKESWWTRRM